MISAAQPPGHPLVKRDAYVCFFLGYLKIKFNSTTVTSDGTGYDAKARGRPLDFFSRKPVQPLVTILDKVVFLFHVFR